MNSQDEFSIPTLVEFGFSGSGVSIVAAVAAPASMGAVLVWQAISQPSDILWLLPFAVFIVAAGVLMYRQALTDSVLRPRNERVILEPPFLIHIGPDGKEDFRARFDEIKSIERVVWLAGDSVTRWTVSSSDSSFVLRQTINRFSELVGYLSQVLPPGVTSALMARWF